jgi:GT2 family glycosyltransferase
VSWPKAWKGGARVTDDVVPAISVVIPTFNRLESLRQVLAALARQTIDPARFEVVVVSDGSSDGTNEYLAGPTPLPLVTACQANGGPASARNRGIELARGRLVLFIDDDVVASPTLVEEHVRTHGDSVDTVVIGPMLNSSDVDYTPWVVWEQAMLYKQYNAMDAGAYKPTFRQFYTGNASVPRDLLVRSGGFDLSLRRAEDVELAYRLSLLGVTFVFNDAAAGHHRAERSFDSWLAAADVYGHNDVTFWRDHEQRWLLPAMAAEFKQRSILTQRLVRACLTRPRLASTAAKLLRTVGVSTGRLSRIVKVSGFALSGLYGLTYYRAAAEEYGDPAAFRELLRTSHPDAEVSGV